eukprot:UN05471
MNTEIIRVYFHSNCLTLNFPSIPSKWRDRFDIEAWNELSSECNNAVKRNARTEKRNIKKIIFIIFLCFCLLFFLGILFLIAYFTVWDYVCTSNDWEKCGDRAHLVVQSLGGTSFGCFGMSGIFAIVLICLKRYYSKIHKDIKQRLTK